MPRDRSGRKTMSNECNQTRDSAEPRVYQIRVKGHLNCHWTDWFGGLTVTLEEHGETTLTGPVIDQAALYGLLRRIRDLGLPLISVNRVEPETAEGYEHRSRPRGER